MQRLPGRWAPACFTALLATQCSAAPSADPAPSQALQELLRLLRGVPSLTAQFVERKRIALLTTPLERRGEITFVHPNTLHEKTHSPEPQDLRIHDGQITLTTPHGTRTLDLRAHPGAEELVTGFLHLLAGDEVALRRIYDMQLRQQGARWHVHLTPRGPPLSTLLRSLEIAGIGNHPTTLRLVDGNGDQTDTEFYAVQIPAPTPSDNTPSDNTPSDNTLAPAPPAPAPP